MPHYFSLRDSRMAGRQKITCKTSQHTHLQPCSPITRWAHFAQGTLEMVWCLKAQTGASDKHNPRKSWVGGTPWSTALSLLRPEAPHAVNGYRFTVALSLTLEKREAEHHLCPCLAHVYRGNIGVEEPALLTKPQMPCRLSVAEEGRLIFLLSGAKPGHKLALCKQRQALNSLDNLLQIICPALLINVCEALGGLNALEPSFA